ncbi:PP2C family protein-serine/threonine phosphatase [Paenibacillus contaminans]|uniref:HAMP domain-containing protein n=1 Tax=Paenibacillus contaminans TaxID=450362 RepID=A0A329MPF9_9BACL|nr:SpoIIE family protein phosphatase [Paenibacillus contaminans]RAV21358.1 hypothetical protein DQG23_11940 [Paenibacillus contaminans]
MIRADYVLLRKLSTIFISIAAAGGGGTFLSNAYISRFSREEAWISALAAVIGYSGLLIILFAYAYVRLGPVRRWLAMGSKGSPAGLWNRLNRFPAEAFVIVAAYGTAVSQLAQFIRSRSAGAAESDFWLEYGKSTLFNLSTMLLLGLAHYCLLQLLLRRYARKLQTTEMPDVRFYTFVRPLAVSFCCVVAFAGIRIIWYAYDRSAEGLPLEIGVFMTIVLAAAGLGTVLFVTVARVFFKELNGIVGELRRLLHKPREELLRSIPLAAGDETGKLASAFNALQTRLNLEYEQMEKDVRLAGGVLRQLLPERELMLPSLAVSFAVQDAGEATGDLYDAIPLDEDRTALVVGSVQGSGMSAALVISALLVLVRAEVRSGGSAGDVLERLRSHFTDALPAGMPAAVGLCMVDARTGAVEAGALGDFTLCCSDGARGIDAAQSASWNSPLLGYAPAGPIPPAYISVEPGSRFVFARSGEGASKGRPAVTAELRHRT